MPFVDSLDWTSLNSLRRYPLREGASALSIDEVFSVPDTLIVDFTLCATSDVTRRFYISKIFNKLAAVTLEISDASGIVVGVINADKSTHYQDKDYYLSPTNNYVGANGKMTIGSLDDLARQPAGSFSFNLAATEFEPRTIVPGLQGIDRLLFIDTLNGSSSLTGDVAIASRSNLRFTYSAGRVTLDAGDGLGLNKLCDNTVCVQSINGVIPDPITGNISLLGVNCLQISNTSQYTLDLADTCLSLIHI